MHPLVPPILEGNLQRLLHGGRPIRREQEHRVVYRHHTSQRLGQLNHRPVPIAEKSRVRHPLQLILHGQVELGHPMTQRGDPQAGNRIQVSTTIHADQLAPLGPLHYHRTVRRVRSHLSEAVPHSASVSLHPACHRVQGHQSTLPRCPLAQPHHAQTPA